LAITRAPRSPTNTKMYFPIVGQAIVFQGPVIALRSAIRPPKKPNYDPTTNRSRLMYPTVSRTRAVKALEEAKIPRVRLSGPSCRCAPGDVV